MSRLYLCLIVLLTVAGSGGNKIARLHKYLSRRHDATNSFLSLHITFIEDGACTIFGLAFSEDTCRYVLEDDYEILRDHFLAGTQQDESFMDQVEIHRSGDCVVEGDTMALEKCRKYMGDKHYDQLYKERFGLPDIDVDDEGYCMMGDTELAPEDCPVMIGQGLYSVLVSMNSYTK